MIITQADRILMQRQVAKYADRLHGELLDVGSGRTRRYKGYCKNVANYRTMDTDPRGEPDIVGSAEAIPLPDASLDSVLCTQVLEHVPHPQKVIQEMYRVLKPGGVCLLTAPQWNELHEEPHDYFRYTKFGLDLMFTETGFTVDVMDQRGKYFANRAQIKTRYLIDVWRPYERKWAMLFIAPLSELITRWGLLRDSWTDSAAAKKHAIGWCVVATKKSA